MASYMDKKIVCKCCGEGYMARMVRGLSQTIVPDLDMNPHDPAVFDRIVMCPHCGYATGNVMEEAGGQIISTVRSEEYRSMFLNPNTDGTEKKLRLAGWLSKKQGLDYDAGYQYLMAYWYMKDRGEDAEKYLSEVINSFSKYLEKHADIETAIILTDCLRQASRFKEAGETAHSLMPYIKKELHRQIVSFELGLIAQKNSSSHCQNEVKP